MPEDYDSKGHSGERPDALTKEQYRIELKTASIPFTGFPQDVGPGRIDILYSTTDPSHPTEAHLYIPGEPNLVLLNQTRRSFSFNSGQEQQILIQLRDLPDTGRVREDPTVTDGPPGADGSTSRRWSFPPADITFTQTAAESDLIDPYDVLLSGQYADRIRFIRQVGGQFLGADFRLTATPTDWLLRLGRYVGNYFGHPVDLHGYWVYRPDANKCWQAVNRGDGALQYWNDDGRASGPPEDWELFTFTAVNRADRTVKINNTSAPTFRLFGGGGPERFFVNLVGDVFSCNDTSAHAAVFVVEFL
jgi:hypothetical protein